MFINRKAELEVLARLYSSDRAELFVLYGRRRVGKTELLRAFCEDKPHLFFIATLSADGEQLATFSQQIWAFTHAETPTGFSFPSWDAAFRALAYLPGRPIVVLAGCRMKRCLTKINGHSRQNWPALLAKER